MAAKMDAARIAASKTVGVAPETEHVIPELIISAGPIATSAETITLTVIPNDQIADDPGSTSWEYTMVSAFAPDVILGLLNEAGAEGWETISVDTYHGVAWLKRLIR